MSNLSAIKIMSTITRLMFFTWSHESRVVRHVQSDMNLIDVEKEKWMAFT